MTKKIFQWNYEISGLIPKPVKLKRKLWLKKDEILLEKNGNELRAFVLGDEEDRGEEKLTRYLWISSLVTTNSAEVSGGSGASLNSTNELGKKPVLTGKLSIGMPDVAVDDMEKHAPKFIKFIGNLHDKYIDAIQENDFITIALDYFHDSEKKFVYSNEGFISAIVSLESMFNEGPSDIKYKLSHRAAFLLGMYGLDPIEAFEKLKVFYNNRSKLVHGGGKLKNDPDRYLVSRYTRRCLIIFLILLNKPERRALGAKKRKEAILREIDYAMLNESGRISLNKEIKKGLKDFDTKIQRTFEGELDGKSYRVTAW